MEPDLLRLVIAGSVDDGKSTLVGRLLHDTGSVLADQLEAVERTSAERGLSSPDLSLLVDGLRAEREQGITIDVAYRYFATERRTFVLADTPGHVQYTRNTVTGASTADHAVLLCDARHGVSEQTRRHLAVMALLRVPTLTLAVNKLDLVDFSQERFTEVRDEFLADAVALGYAAEDMAAVPMSALTGDNVAEPSDRTPWYDGATVLDRLETVAVPAAPASGLRMAVQYILRPEASEERSYAGRIGAGTVRVGDEVLILPAGTPSRVTRIDTPDGPLEEAGAGESVGLVLADHLDVGRGDVVAGVDGPPRTADEFTATVCWLGETPLRAGDRYLLRHGTRTLSAAVLDLSSRLDATDLTTTEDVTELGLNDLGRVRLRVAAPLPLDDYGRCRATGSFLLIDRSSGDTLGGGMVAEEERC